MFCPRVSVIIPTLQEEKLIGRMLDQFTPEIRIQFGLEIIVSDGGSTDRTMSIAEPIADRVVRSGGAPGENIARGRNRGSRVARGEVLVFLNADVCIPEPERFFREVLAAIDCSGVAAATCRVAVYTDEERPIDRLFHRICNEYFRILNVIGMGMGRGECQVVRKTLFDSVGGYDEALAAGEDFEFFLRLRRRGKVVFLRSITVYESPRRYRRVGYGRIAALWFLNATSAFVFRRSFTKAWEPVR